MYRMRKKEGHEFHSTNCINSTIKVVTTVVVRTGRCEESHEEGSAKLMK